MMRFSFNSVFNLMTHQIQNGDDQIPVFKLQQPQSRIAILDELEKITLV